MKKIIIIIGLILLGTQALWATVTVDGHAYLDNQTQHSGIEVYLEMTVPHDSTYTVYTDNSGYYSLEIIKNHKSLEQIEDRIVMKKEFPINFIGNSKSIIILLTESIDYKLKNK